MNLKIYFFLIIIIIIIIINIKTSRTCESKKNKIIYEMHSQPHKHLPHGKLKAG